MTPVNILEEGIKNFIPDVTFQQAFEKTGRAMNVSVAAARRSTREWFNALATLVDKADKKNGNITRATSMLRSIINQDYIGDINILPRRKLSNPLRLLGFPGEKRMQDLIDEGERRTWPKLEMIRLQTRISRKLDGILRHYESHSSHGRQPVSGLTLHDKG